MTTSTQTYVVCGCRPWNRGVFDRSIQTLPGSWHFIGQREELTADCLARMAPRFVFFLHWSWIVPSEIADNYECVCFHMTDVPYGRGGSPLQNLIVRGHDTTKLTALRMTEDLDAGPVYMKRELSLSGAAEEIYIRASELSAEMIRSIVDEDPTPTPQQGEPTLFRRRTPAESCISSPVNLTQVFDHIRMLDAADYPHAYIDREGFRYEFRGASLLDGKIEANVTITPVEEDAA